MIEKKSKKLIWSNNLNHGNMRNVISNAIFKISIKNEFILLKKVNYNKKNS